MKDLNDKGTKVIRFTKHGDELKSNQELWQRHYDEVVEIQAKTFPGSLDRFDTSVLRTTGMSFSKVTNSRDMAERAVTLVARSRTAAGAAGATPYRLRWKGEQTRIIRRQFRGN